MAKDEKGRGKHDEVPLAVETTPNKKPYTAPQILFLENLEAMAGTCDGGKTEGACGAGPYTS